MEIGGGAMQEKEVGSVHGVNKKEKRNKKRGRMERHTEKARWRKWEERELYGGKRGNG